ncbi:MAG: hypothetical protein CMM70_03215 [Rhodospirillaceae bacterium]|nr:hypothetical protein [Rhodospirillaceae bacterium]
MEITPIMRNPLIKLLIALTLTLAGWTTASTAANAQAFDPQDPYRRAFLDMMLTFTSAAELSEDWNEDWDSIRAARDLQEELRVCGTFYRRDLLNHLLLIMREASDEPEVLSGIADVVRASVAFSNMDEELGKFSLEAISDDILGRSDIQGLVDLMTRYFGLEDQYYGNLWFGEALTPRGLAPARLSMDLYPKAEFLVGDIQKFMSYAETAFGSDFLDWPITAAMRAGRDDLARRLQQDYDRTKPTNITKLLFLETPTAQAAHCQGLLQGVRDRLVERENLTARAEAETTGVRFASWTLLLCGQFADSRRSARKMGWERMSRSCGFNRETSNVTDFYNAILSGSYLATEQRKNGELLRSAFTLEEIVAEVRQVLYLDSFTGLGHINIVVDEDIELYMTHLHGMTPELRVVQGLLEEARGNTALAVDAWKAALAEDELHERWVITLQAWVNAQSSRVSLLSPEETS